MTVKRIKLFTLFFLLALFTLSVKATADSRLDAPEQEAAFQENLRKIDAITDGSDAWSMYLSAYMDSQHTDNLNRNLIPTSKINGVFVDTKKYILEKMDTLTTNARQNMKSDDLKIRASAKKLLNRVNTEANSFFDRLEKKHTAIHDLSHSTLDEAKLYRFTFRGLKFFDRLGNFYIATGQCRKAMAVWQDLLQGKTAGKDGYEATHPKACKANPDPKAELVLRDTASLSDEEKIQIKLAELKKGLASLSPENSCETFPSYEFLLRKAKEKDATLSEQNTSYEKELCLFDNYLNIKKKVYSVEHWCFGKGEDLDFIKGPIESEQSVHLVVAKENTDKEAIEYFVVTLDKATGELVKKQMLFSTPIDSAEMTEKDFIWQDTDTGSRLLVKYPQGVSASGQVTASSSTTAYSHVVLDLDFDGKLIRLVDPRLFSESFELASKVEPDDKNDKITLTPPVIALKKEVESTLALHPFDPQSDRKITVRIESSTVVTNSFATLLGSQRSARRMDKKLFSEQASPSTRASFKFVEIKPGEFQMGSPASEMNRGSNEKQHKVTLTKAFHIQATPITQLQWFLVMGNNPAYFKQEENCKGSYVVIRGVSLCPDNPVETVSWEDIQTFISRLNDLDPKHKYSLPTEAQWEFAARGGKATAYSFGDNPDGLKDYGWYAENSERHTHPVAEKKANEYALYDMHGNVWQWTQDWYDGYADSATNPTGPAAGSSRVIRGGSWYNFAQYCRSARRYGFSPS